MRFAELFKTPVQSSVLGPRPRDSEIDMFGVTHPGRVRKENQDHFLLATVHPTVVIHGTNLPLADDLPLRGQRLATMMLVADGVGGTLAGADASRLATETITRYVSSSIRCYHTVGTSSDNEFLEALRTAALEAHAAIRADSAMRFQGQTIATTLTLGIVVWPWLYVLQVGDSRCYTYFDGTLRQISRDQTVAQDLVDKGILPASRASSTKLSNVLSSALGAEEARPEVTRVDVRDRGTVVLVCSDGLTKHVSDDEIAEAFKTMDSAEQVSQALLDQALERGGSDNITIVVGRARRKPGEQR